MSPSGLMAHFESDEYKKNPVHFGVKAYVWALYKNYHKVSGNKCEYKVRYVHYKTSEAEVKENIHTNNEVQSVGKNTHKTPVPGNKKI